MTGFDAGPVAARLRRPSWRDPRLAIGVLLVVVSVVLGSWVVTSAQHTTPVYVAVSALLPGQELRTNQVNVAEVRLTEPEAYLSATEPLPSGLVVVRTVGAGELVPLSALASAAALTERAVGIAVDGPLAATVQPGSLVDVWFTPDGGTQGPGEPTLLGEALTVAEVQTGGGAFSAVGDTVVHVFVPTEDLAPLLAALADKGDVRIVPVPGVAHG